MKTYWSVHIIKKDENVLVYTYKKRRKRTDLYTFNLMKMYWFEHIKIEVNVVGNPPGR